MSVKRRFKQWVDQRFFKFVDKRVPKHTEHTLNRHNLYTFPTPMGFAYLLLALLIWLLGTNYQNNLILALSYLMLSIFVITILHAYFNLAGVSVSCKSAQPCFVGEILLFKVQIQARSKNGCDGLQLKWQPRVNTTNHKAVINIYDQPSVTATVGCIAPRRGAFSPKRLRVESVYPLGLIRCWCWLNFSNTGLVYPEPKPCAWPESTGAGEDGEQVAVRTTGDEFYGFRPYQSGDALKTIAWKHYARDRGLVTLQHASPATAEVWLNWQSFSHAGVENSLSYLCYWALQLHQQDLAFGLVLPEKTFAPSRGDRHLNQVLQALACYGHAS